MEGGTYNLVTKGKLSELQSVCETAVTSPGHNSSAFEGKYVFYLTSLAVLRSVSDDAPIVITCRIRVETFLVKIQGDGRKFLDRFKSYLGSKISSQSLNEIHIYRLQPKSARKDDFFHMLLSLIVSSRRRILPFDV